MDPVKNPYAPGPAHLRLNWQDATICARPRESPWQPGRNHGRKSGAGRRKRGGVGQYQGAAMKLAKSFCEDIRSIILSARATVARGVNLVQVHTNFEIGRRIVEEEQKGKSRAAYGEAVIKAL